MPVRTIGSFGLGVIAALTAATSPAFAEPLTTSFTFRGELQAGGVPAAGLYDLRFRLYDAPAGGAQVGPALCSDNVAFEGGRFTVTLDFGGVFAGQRRYIEIDVRADSGLGCANGAGFETLAPRTELLSTPHTQHALTAGAATTAQTAASAASAANAAQLNGQAAGFYQNASNLTSGNLPNARLSGTYTSRVNLTNTTNTLHGVFSGDGAALTALNASSLSTGTVPDARLSGNIPRLASDQTFAGANVFLNPGNVFTGSGAGLTGLDASQLLSGVMPEERLGAGVLSRLPRFEPAAQPLIMSGPTIGTGIAVGAFPLAFDGRYVYSVTHNVNLSFLEVREFDYNPVSASSPYTLTPRGGRMLNGVAFQIRLFGGHAYVFSRFPGSSNTELYILSLANPAQPGAPVFVPLGPGVGSPNGQYGDAFGHGRLYLRRGAVVEIYSLADPTQPALVGSFPVPSTIGSLAVHGGLLAFAGNGSLTLYDPTDPAAVITLGSVPLFGPLNNMVRSAGSRLIAYSQLIPPMQALQAKIEVISASIPGSPVILGAASTPIIYVQGEGGFDATPEGVYLCSTEHAAAYSLMNGDTPYMTDQQGSDDFVDHQHFGALTVSGGLMALTTNDAAILMRQSVHVWAARGAVFADPLRAAGGLYGDASHLTGLNASNIQSGWLSTDRLPPTAAQTDLSQEYYGRPKFFGGQTGSTPPFTVNSTFKVANLNADLLDGLDSTAFAPASHTHSATHITSDTLADARLSSNVALLAGAQTFSGAKAFSNAANSFTGSGAGLTNLNAANITSDTLADARLSANVALLAGAQTFSGTKTFSNAANAFAGTFTGTHIGSGSGLTALNAANLASGTVPDARLASNIARRDAAVSSFTGTVYARGDDANAFAAFMVDRDTSGNPNLPGLRVRFDNATKLLVMPNGGTSIGSNNSTPPANGLAVSGSISKGGGSFKIDHPLDPANKFLYHSFVESPDMMNIYNGNTTTDDRGYATVELPEWFDALNRDFRYQLTVLDDNDEDDAFLWAKVVRRIGTDARNRFTIRTSRPGLEVSWQVTGVRKDAWAEQNRIPVEVDKPAGERGRYLHPEAFGLPPARAVGAGTEPVRNMGPSPSTGG